MVFVRLLSIKFYITLAILCIIGAVNSQYVSIKTQDGKNADNEDENEDAFVPTEEWQTVKKGQSIPRGLHVKLNLETGEKEAKLINKNEKLEQTDVAPIYVDKNEKTDSEKSNVAPNKERIRESILEIDDIEDSVATDKDVERVRKEFRSYEELKQKFEELNLNIKTDLELVNDLLQRFRSHKLKDDSDDDDKINILTDLEYLAHQVDNAKEFIQIGGISDILPLLNASSSRLRSAAAHLFGSAAQSNPQVQIALLETGTLTALVRTVALDTDTTVRSRALFALSCLIRNFPIAQAQFVADGGLSGLAELFAAGDSHEILKLQLKVATLLQDLLQERADAVLVVDEQKEERIRQYEKANLEAHLSEQGWCGRLVRLLASQAQLPGEGFGTIRRDDFSSAVSAEVPVLTHHDAVEKVAGAVLALARGPCQQDYRGNSLLAAVVSELHSWYKELAIREARSDGNYFSGLSEIFDQLSVEVGIKARTKEEL